MGALFKIRITGLENIPSSSSFVLLPKHQRWEDIPILGISVAKPLYYIAKIELFRPSVIGAYLSALGGIPLNRERPLGSRRHLKRVVDHLNAGEGVVIFPEGTYRKNYMGPGRLGLIRMVISKTSPPFLPVGIRYRAGIRKKVEIRIGKAFMAGPSKEAGSFLERMMKEIGRLSGF
jgi:1-acyl-sn-glycerol-3-phosphate acyltransferase